MGSNSSRQIKEEELKREAMRKFNIRINMYSYAHHGNHFEYIEWCRAEYQLDCIDPICYQGPNYKAQYDHWGNQT
jgi:hypothetical protein